MLFFSFVFLSICYHLSFCLLFCISFENEAVLTSLYFVTILRLWERTVSNGKRQKNRREKKTINEETIIETVDENRLKLTAKQGKLDGLENIIRLWLVAVKRYYFVSKHEPIQDEP